MLKEVLATNHIIYFLIEEDIKMENAPIFYDEFIKSNDYLGKKVFFDFSKINFIDSSGIGILIRCVDYLRERSSELIFVSVSKSMNTVFRLAGLNQFFNIIEKKELSQYLKKEELEKLVSNR
jgi:anti-anti-sigma factor